MPSKRKDLTNVDLLPDPWNPDWPLAMQVMEFMETCTVPAGILAGEKFMLQEWQCRTLEKLYGPERPRQAVLSVPRKNGKTAFGALLCLAYLFGPLREPHGECYSAANTRDQASIMYNMLDAMIRVSPYLMERAAIYPTTKSIYSNYDQSKYAALSAEATHALGLSPCMVFYDELGSARNRVLWDALATAGGARKHPLIMAGSTQAAIDKHIMSELVDYGRAVESGQISDEKFAAIIFAADKDDDIFSPDTWEKANPALGHNLNRDEIQVAAKQAQFNPDRIPAFRNLQLNQRVSYDAGYINPVLWKKHQEPGILINRNEVSYVGITSRPQTPIFDLVIYQPDPDTLNAVLCCEEIPKNELDDWLDEHPNCLPMAMHWNFWDVKPLTKYEVEKLPHDAPFITSSLNSLEYKAKQGNIIHDGKLNEEVDVAIKEEKDTEFGVGVTLKSSETARLLLAALVMGEAAKKDTASSLVSWL